MSNEPEVFEVLRKIRYDLTAAQGKVTEAMRMLSALNLEAEPEPFQCPKGCRGFSTERGLAFHMANVHDGPAVPLNEEELRVVQEIDAP